MPASPATIPSLCHAISPSLKLGLTLTVILLASVIPLANWPAHGVLFAIVLAGLSLANVPMSYIGKRLAMFLPMLLVFGLTIPLTQWDKQAAWLWMIVFWMRCLVAFLAGLWLIHVLPFSELLVTMLRWHCPPLLVAMLSFMYRYIFILWDELARLRRARDSRDFGHGSIVRRWTGNAQMIGLLLLRAMERAERTHHAMLARGWDGSVRFLTDEPGSPS